MLEHDAVQWLTVTDLKQYTFCPRVLYYYQCLPAVRPLTHKMELGIEHGREEKRRSTRRTLHAYGLEEVEGQRVHDLHVQSDRLGMTGIIDEVIQVLEPEPLLIPVDYKLSRKVGSHFKVQLAAYAMLLEDTYDIPSPTGYVVLIPLRETVEVPITTRLRNKTIALIEEIRAMIGSEWMPPPLPSNVPCRDCEFRRFCNDV